jgi:hypothetical protein
MQNGGRSDCGSGNVLTEFVHLSRLDVEPSILDLVNKSFSKKISVN